MLTMKLSAAHPTRQPASLCRSARGGTAPGEPQPRASAAEAGHGTARLPRQRARRTGAARARRSAATSGARGNSARSVPAGDAGLGQRAEGAEGRRREVPVPRSGRGCVRQKASKSLRKVTGAPDTHQAVGGCASPSCARLRCPRSHRTAIRADKSHPLHLDTAALATARGYGGGERPGKNRGGRRIFVRCFLVKTCSGQARPTKGRLRLVRSLCKTQRRTVPAPSLRRPLSGLA